MFHEVVTKAALRCILADSLIWILADFHPAQRNWSVGGGWVDGGGSGLGLLVGVYIGFILSIRPSMSVCRQHRVCSVTFRMLWLHDLFGLHGPRCPLAKKNHWNYSLTHSLTLQRLSFVKDLLHTWYACHVCMFFIKCNEMNFRRIFAIYTSLSCFHVLRRKCIHDLCFYHSYFMFGTIIPLDGNLI